jgi:hypothetical protein
MAIIYKYIAARLPEPPPLHELSDNSSAKCKILSGRYSRTLRWFLILLPCVAGIDEIPV